MTHSLSVARSARVRSWVLVEPLPNAPNLGRTHQAVSVRSLEPHKSVGANAPNAPNAKSRSLSGRGYSWRSPRSEIAQLPSMGLNSEQSPHNRVQTPSFDLNPVANDCIDTASSDSLFFDQKSSGKLRSVRSVRSDPAIRGVLANAPSSVRAFGAFGAFGKMANTRVPELSPILNLSQPTRKNTRLPAAGHNFHHLPPNALTHDRYPIADCSQTPRVLSRSRRGNTYPRNSTPRTTTGSHRHLAIGCASDSCRSTVACDRSPHRAGHRPLPATNLGLVRLGSTRSRNTHPRTDRNARRRGGSDLGSTIVRCSPEILRTFRTLG